MAIPALLSKKANAPVMMRITREEEHYIGRARPGILARVKVGFRKDGRITAIDMFTVGDNGPYDAQGDCRSAGNTVSLCLSAEGDAVARRHRADQHAAEDVAARAGRHAGHRPHRADARQGGASKLGIDQVEIRKINAPAGKAPFGPAAARRQAGVRDERVRQGSARQGRASCSTGTRRRRDSGKRSGTKVRGIGVAVSPYSGGSIGFDGLFIIKPDGRVQFQSGIGNLGTHSVFDVHRVAAEMLGVPWEQCDVVFGNTARTCRGPASRPAARRRTR